MNLTLRERYVHLMTNRCKSPQRGRRLFAKAISHAGMRLGAAALLAALAQPASAASDNDASAPQTSEVPTGDPASAGSAGRLFELTVPAQMLDRSLLELARVSGIQLLYPPTLTRDIPAPAVSGRYSLSTLLGLLLGDSGLGFRFSADNTVTIERAQAGTRTLGAVRIVGRNDAKGANGSRDLFATEGSGTYAALGAGVGSVGSESLRETPRSISVLGQPQIQDQGITEITDAIVALQGATIIGIADGEGSPVVRGFAVYQAQLDGGNAFFNGVDSGSVRSLGELSPYDRVELLRGGDGLNNGYVSPGGIFNLVRKRPLDHQQLIVETQAGSFDRYRGMIDATSPLGFNGRLRGRVVLAGLDYESFIDRAYKKRNAYYGIVEADITPSALLSFGVQNYDQSNSSNISMVLPSATDGRPVGFARSTSFILPWDRDRYESRHLFANWEQRLGSHWNARLALDREENVIRTLSAFVVGRVDRATGDGLSLIPFNTGDQQNIDLASFKLSGRYQWRGLEQIVAFSLNSTQYRLNYDGPLIPDADEYDNPDFNAYDFNPADFPRPSLLPTRDINFRSRSHARSGSVSLTLSPWSPLKLIGAWRWSSAALHQVLYEETGDIRLDAGEHYQAPSYFAINLALGEHWSGFASWSDVYERNTYFIRADGGPLDPALGSNYELGIKYISADRQLNTTLSLYRVEQRNYARQISDGPEGILNCCYDNGSNARAISEGFDFDVSGTPLPGWQIVGGYSYNRDRQAGSDAPNPGGPLDPFSPKHLLKVWSVWRPSAIPRQALQLGAGVQLQSEANLVLIRDGDTVTREALSGGLALFNALVGWQFDSHWSLNLRAENLFDRTYFLSANADGANGVYYGGPLSLTLTLRGTY